MLTVAVEGMEMIYILEDDDSIRKLVTYALQSQGFSAEGFASPTAFYKAMQKKIPSLLLLDIMLPGEDGISILRKLRADPRTSGLPVIMLTAKSTEYDHVEGLDAGADDYVAKPFGMMELLARVRALLRRTQTVEAARGGVVPVSSGGGAEEMPKTGVKTEDGQRAAQEYSYMDGEVTYGGNDAAVPFSEHPSTGMPGAVSGGISVYGGKGAADRGRKESSAERLYDPGRDPGIHGTEAAAPHMTTVPRDDVLQFGILRIYPKRYEVYVEESEISLTNKEYQLLLLLVENEGIVLTREILLDRIWDLGSEPENRTLDVHIRKLRSKLGAAAVWIETIRGVGYRFRDHGSK